MNILVCGGAGYIGSHMVRRLLEVGHSVTVVDNLSHGHLKAIPECEIVVADVRDSERLEQVFRLRRYEAVMHFCGKISVPESVALPYEYYANNVGGSLVLLEAMRAHGVERFIFSSSAAVYGTPLTDLLKEDHAKLPTTPYGATKRMVERILEDAACAYGLSSVSLRYFNAAGASPNASVGESHHPETHLIPNVLKAAVDPGLPVKIYGNDYPTPDGTCIRDYVHVDDLAEAHLQAIHYLDSHPGAHAMNLGMGRGFSVLEVLQAARRVTGREIAHEFMPRRPGDVPALVAHCELAARELGWTPRYQCLEPILETAWKWHQAPAF